MIKFGHLHLGLILTWVLLHILLQLKLRRGSIKVLSEMGTRRVLLLDAGAVLTLFFVEVNSKWLLLSFSWTNGKFIAKNLIDTVVYIDTDLRVMPLLKVS